MFIILHIIVYDYLPVVPGQAGGGSFHSLKKHTPIRTRRPIEKKSCTRPLNDMFAALESSTDVFDCDSIDALQHRIDCHVMSYHSCIQRTRVNLSTVSTGTATSRIIQLHLPVGI